MIKESQVNKYEVELSEICGTQFQEENSIYLIRSLAVNSSDIWFSNGAFRTLAKNSGYILFWFTVEPYRVEEVTNYLTHTFNKERDDSVYITKRHFERIEDSVKKLFKEYN
jgi:hypothetical protein